MKRLPPYSDSIVRKHLAYCRALVEEPLVKMERDENDSTVKPYLARIIQFVSAEDGGENGFVAPADTLRAFVREIECQYFLNRRKLPDNLKTANKNLANAFNYAKFSQQPTDGTQWYAAKLMKEALKNLQYCPYCNADMVYAMDTRGRIARSAFDHFFPAARYPFLALSLYNLIPSCHRCNSSFKRSLHKEPQVSFHPCLDDVDDATRFVLIGLTNEMRYCEPEDNTLSVRLLPRPNHSEAKQAQLENYQALFRIDEVYSKLYNGWALRILHLGTVMNKAYRTDIERRIALAGLHLDAARLLFDTPLKRSEIDRHHLAKLKLDILEQYCGIEVEP